MVSDLWRAGRPGLRRQWKGGGGDLPVPVGDVQQVREVAGVGGVQGGSRHPGHPTGF